MSPGHPGRGGPSTPNIVAELREWAQPLVERLRAFPEVEGIVLLAGVANRPSRPFADRYSDVDLALFLNEPVVPPGVRLKAFTLAHQDRLSRWLPDYDFSLPLSRRGRREVNLHQLLYSYECRDDVEWPEAKKEAYAYTSEVVYDRAGRVQELIAAKTRYDPQARNDRLARLAVQVPWSGWLNPERQFRRGLIAAAHDLVTEAVDLVTEALFLLNSRYGPHRKWRLLGVEQLPWKPARCLETIRHAMLVRSFDVADVRRRMRAVRRLWAPMLARATAEQLVRADAEHYVATHVSLNRQLRVTTVADEVVSAVTVLGLSLDPDDVRGLVDYLVLESPQDFSRLLGDPGFRCPVPLRRAWAAIGADAPSRARLLASLLGA